MNVENELNILKAKLIKAGIDISDASVNDVIYNFEESLDKQYKKEHGIVYTPQWVADAMAWRTINLKLRKITGHSWDEIIENTSSKYTNSMVHMLWDEALKLKICDPCTGAGVFIFSILRAYLRMYRIASAGSNRYLSELDLVLDLLKNNIYAIELDSSAVDVTHFRLWAYCVQLGYTGSIDELKTNIYIGDALNTSFEGLNTEYSHHLTEVDEFIRENYISEWEKNWDIYKSNSSEKDKTKAKIELVNIAIQITSDITSRDIPFRCDRRIIKNKNKFKTFSWILEFSELFEDNIDDKGFDIIIGNPPYVRNIDNTELKSDILGSTANLYMYFLELGNTRGKKECITSMIVPNNWFTAAYAREFREVYTDKIESIIDFNMHYVFKGVFIATAIITLHNDKPLNDTISYANVENIMDEHRENELLQYYQERELLIPKTRLRNPRKYIFGDPRLYAILDKVSNLPTLYEQYGATVERGMVVDVQDRCEPGTDTTYIVKGEDILTFGTLYKTKLATKLKIHKSYKNYLIIPEVTRKIRCCKLGDVIPLDSTVYIENTNPNLIALLNSEIFNLLFSIMISTNFMISYAEVRFPRKNKSLEQTPVPTSLDSLDIFRKATKDWETVSENDTVAFNEYIRELYGLTKEEVEVLRKYNV